MAIRKIQEDPHPALRAKAKPIKTINERIRRQAIDLVDTLESINIGIGLAANQVGLLRRMFVLRLPEDEQTTIFINPEITEREGIQESNEGCLSCPGRDGVVERPQSVTVRAQDIDGNDFILQAEGLRAACICHECDHLDGILFYDRVTTE
ncbi:MAG: peptide deformylase [Clostridiaceae bacterium]|jgi:peptide deformylase|nr:peptide deformylase [Clostridiaceae bacterium]